MPSRRTLMAAGAAAATGPLVAIRAKGATPPNTIVMADQIDDAVSFDPGHGRLVPTATANWWHLNSAN